VSSEEFHLTLFLHGNRERQGSLAQFEVMGYDENLFFSCCGGISNDCFAFRLCELSKRDDNRRNCWAERRPRFLAFVCDDSPWRYGAMDMGLEFPQQHQWRQSELRQRVAGLSFSDALQQYRRRKCCVSRRLG